MEKKILFAVIGLTIVAVLLWVVWETKPKPGQKLPDLGRTHVPIGTKMDYNSNPPTSGNHYEVWVKAGIYDAPKDDRNLVHSLEHGYIIMSYNCDFKTTSSLLIKNVSAQAMEPMGTTPEDASAAASLPETFKSDSCKTLVNQLKGVMDKKGQHKMIIIPRPNLDAKIALTAWDYLDKFNDVDSNRIEKFIDGHRDDGPEKTYEP